MQIRKAAFMALALWLAMTACSASGDPNRKSGEPCLLKGTVRVVGNAPFTRLVLTVPPSERSGRPTDHLIQGPLAEDIRSRFQGRVVTVEGRRCAESPSCPLPCIEPERIVGVE